jgi:hypothetical protein
MHAMVKICTSCHYVNAGGFRCSECDGRLIMVTDPEAQELPDHVWKTQRVDYGARRGMIYRFFAIFLGAGVGLYGLRESLALESPWAWIAGAVSIIAGFAVWRFFFVAADRGVRVWVLAKGKVRKGRLVRAIVLSLLPKWSKKLGHKVRSSNRRLYPRPER